MKNSKVSRRKEIIKKKKKQAERNEEEMKETIEKSDKIKRWFFERIK